MAETYTLESVLDLWFPEVGRWTRRMTASMAPCIRVSRRAACRSIKTS